MGIQIGFELESCWRVPEPAIRKKFKEMGYNVKVGRAENHQGPYSIEAGFGFAVDGSVHPELPSHLKLEIISPVFKLNDGLDALEKIFTWMETSKAGYTNATCGFHVGVSDSDPKAMAKFNVLKLALLLDEDTILNKFGRIGSHWTNPVKPRIISQVEHLLYGADKLHKPVEAFLKDAVPRQKEMTANLTKLPNYVEFRAMGGNYSTKLEEVKKTILHYADCIHAACDAEYRKDEYEKKLAEFIELITHRAPKFRKLVVGEEAYLKQLIERDIRRRKLRVRNQTVADTIEIVKKVKAKKKVVHWGNDGDEFDDRWYSRPRDDLWEFGR